MGLRVALLNPSFIYQTPHLQMTEPLGILYLASYLRSYSTHQVTVVDSIDSGHVRKLGPGRYLYGLTEEEMLARLAVIRPDVIGITCLFSRKKDDFYAAARAIKVRFPDVRLVAGGTYPSLFPEEVIASGLFAYAVIGEGEESFTALLDAMAAGVTPEGMDGLAYAEGKEIRVVPKENYIHNLDAIPFPARDLIRYERYRDSKSVLHGLGLKRSASILTSRSCPNRCNFCSMFKIHGGKWRSRSATNVVEEIKELKERYAIEHLFIMDDNLTFNKPRMLEICSLLTEANLGIRWNTPNGIAIRNLDKPVLTAMKKAGCTSICVAIETGDEDLRNTVIGKHLKDDKIREVTEAARELGLFVVAFYIIGMPGETEEKFAKTLEQLRTLPLNGAAAAFANPLPGTRLFEDCQKFGYTILRCDSDDNIFYRPYIVTQEFTEDELIQREKRFYRTFMRAKFFTILKDALLMRNGLLYPPFLMRILRDRLLRN